MKAHLVFAETDFDATAPALANEETLRQDLELETILAAMAGDDAVIYEAARVALLSPLTEPEEIRFRQSVLTDCLCQRELVRELLNMARAALIAQRQFGWYWRKSPESILSSSISAMEALLRDLHGIRDFAAEHASEFQSAGFTRLFAMLQVELCDEFFDAATAHLGTLAFRDGVLISASLGPSSLSTDLILRLPPHRSWTKRLGRLKRAPHSFDVHPRDEGSLRALGDLKARGLNAVANALAQSVDHVKSFLQQLVRELAFYVGCVNLSERLTDLGASTCVPSPIAAGHAALDAHELYDLALTLQLGKEITGNTIKAENGTAIVVTGANQGGKTTFLRSVGQAQLMLQCGMLVGANSFAADLRDLVFTHFKREEDAQMQSGKLDEELGRMSEIVTSITPSSLLLCNESFGSTNEREGSEIASQVTRALTASGVKVVFVTHLYEFAHAVAEKADGGALFLRAPRGEGIRRDYHLEIGPPLPTSFGRDTYLSIFGFHEVIGGS